MATRAYPAVSSRQQDADRLAYSEADVRRMLVDAASRETVSTIRLGGEVILTRPILLDAADYNVVVDGGGKYGFRCASSWTADHIFDVGARTVSGVTLLNLTFNAPARSSGIVQSIFRADSAAAILDDVNLQGCRTFFVTRLFITVTGDATWRYSKIDDVFMRGGNALLGGSVGQAVFIGCDFRGVRTLSSVGGTVVEAFISPVGASSDNDLAGLRFGAFPVVLPPQSVLISRTRTSRFRSVGQGTATVTIAAATPFLDISSNAGVYDVSFGAGFYSIAITIIGTTAGRIVTLRCTANTSSSPLLSDGVGLFLTAPWFPQPLDTLTLVGLADDTGYVEVARTGGIAINLAVTTKTTNTASPTVTIDPSDSLIYLTVGAGTSGTVTLSAGTRDGQQITIVCRSLVGTLQMITSGANRTIINGGVPWTITANTSIQMVWVASSNIWLEIPRR